MTLTELLPNIRRLSTSEKHQLLHILMTDLGESGSGSGTETGDSKAELLADLQQSLQDVQDNRLFPLETLWDGVEG